MKNENGAIKEVFLTVLEKYKEIPAVISWQWQHILIK